jgi:hypothetical protein
MLGQQVLRLDIVLNLLFLKFLLNGHVFFILKCKFFLIKGFELFYSLEMIVIPGVELLD